MLNQAFFQVALPMMFTMVLTVWALISTNNRRLDNIVARLGRIEDKAVGHREPAYGGGAESRCARIEGVEVTKAPQ